MDNQTYTHTSEGKTVAVDHTTKLKVAVKVTYKSVDFKICLDKSVGL